MPMTESEWQELSDFLAREIMKWIKWEELTEEEREAVMVVKVEHHHHAAYWWQPDYTTYDFLVMYPGDTVLGWQPQNNIVQAMLVLKTLLNNIGHYAEAELHIRISPNRCRVTIQNWVATRGTPAGWVRSQYVENEMKAICLAAKEWCDVSTR